MAVWGSFYLRPQSLFRFPDFSQSFALRNLLWSHLSFGCTQLVLIKLQIVFSGQPQPHIGLDRLARKLALQIRLTQKQLSVLVPLRSGQPHPFQPFRAITVGQLFFCQAEDVIRGGTVNGVQTCLFRSPTLIELLEPMHESACASSV